MLPRLEKSGDIKSHPLWVRGLKSILPTYDTRIVTVAPLVGAWIEIVF